jgi:hypothetical protein
MKLLRHGPAGSERPGVVPAISRLGAWGVGLGQKPPRYLKAGDVMELGIESLGRQRQTVVTEEHDR